MQLYPIAIRFVLGLKLLAYLKVHSYQLLLLLKLLQSF
jgi:hypothetical protein